MTTCLGISFLESFFSSIGLDELEQRYAKNDYFSLRIFLVNMNKSSAFFFLNIVTIRELALTFLFYCLYKVHKVFNKSASRKNRTKNNKRLIKMMKSKEHLGPAMVIIVFSC